MIIANIFLTFIGLALQAFGSVYSVTKFPFFFHLNQDPITKDISLNSIPFLENIARPEFLFLYESPTNQSVFPAAVATLYGQWTGNNNIGSTVLTSIKLLFITIMQMFGTFLNNEGFVAFGNNGSASTSTVSWDIAIMFYDGQYIDQGYAQLTINQDLSDFEFNPPNSYILRCVNITITIYRSFYGQNLSLKFEYGEGSFSSTTKDSDLPYVQGDTNMGVQIILQSPECFISLQTGVLLSGYPITESQLFIFIATIILYTTIGGVACKVVRSNYPNKPDKIKRISVWSVLLLNYYDGYLMLTQLIDSALYTPWLVLAAFLIFVFEILPETAIAYTIHIMQRGPFTNREDFGPSCKLFAIYYVIFLALLLLTICVKYAWIPIISSLFLIPQIIHTFKEGKKRNVEFWYVILFSVSRVGVMILTQSFICQSVYFGNSRTTIQYRFPRFFFTKRRYSYKINIDNPEEKRELCPICMEALGDVPFEIKKTVTEEQPSQAPLFQTPCKHRYHEKCLKEWLKRKFECPFCKQELPSLTLEVSERKSSDPLHNSAIIVSL